MKILHLEDNVADAQRVADSLAAAGMSAAIQRVDSLAGFEAALRSAADLGGLDLILARYALPALSGPQALALAQQVCPGLPFIFVAISVSLDQWVEALRQGATDYVLKTDLARLPQAVERALRAGQERTGRVQAETEAAAEREWLRVTLASIGDAVIATDTGARLTFMNPAAEQLTGWPQAEAAGQPVERVFDIINEADQQTVESPVARVIRDGRVVGLPNHTLLVRRDGRKVTIDASGAPIYDQQRQLIGVVLIFRDIRRRRAAEQALTDSEERFRTLITTTSAIVWTAGPDGAFVTPQRSWQTYTGQAWDEQQGWGWLRMIHPDDRDAVRVRWQAAVAEHKPYAGHGRVWNVKAHEHCYYEARAVPLLNPDGSLREWIGTLDDVHQRELARLAARESEGRFRILADTAPVLVWMARPDGGVEFVNQTWLAFTGRGQEHELGDGWAAGVHADDFDRCLFNYRAALTQRQPFQQEYRLRRHDGHYRWMLDTGVPRFDADRRFAGFVGSIIDIHERKVSEEALRTRAVRQAELADLGQRALAGLDLSALMDEVAQVVSRTLPVEFCEVLELLPGGQALRLVAGLGWQPGLVGQAVVSAGAQSQAGFTLLSDEPVVLDDLARETRFHSPALLVEHGAVSGVTTIIRGADEPWGVLGAFTRQRRDFGPDDANFLQSIANVLADAIARARTEAALRVAHEQTVAILGGVAEGVTVQGRDSRLVYANDTAARLLGFADAEALINARPGEILGKYDLLDEAGAPLPVERLPGRRALQGERDAELLVRFRVRATGEERWAQDHAQPVFNSQGQVELAVSIFHDITDLKRAEIIQSLLAGAGELLARDLDTPALMKGLAELPVPYMADYCAIYQLDAGGQVRASASAHADPSQNDLLRELIGYRQPNPDEDSPVRQALLRQEPVLLTGIDRAHASQTMAPEIRHLAHLVPHTLVLAPLVAREHLLGVLLLARVNMPQPFQPADQALAQELARRAALALDNSQLYTDSQRLNAQLEERVQARTEELHVVLEQLQQSNAELETENSERQAAEEMLRQSERQLAQAQQIARVGSWRWDVPADTMTWSDVLCDIHGLTLPVATLSYAEFLDQIHPDDRSRVNAILGAARRAGQPFEYDHRILRADGAVRALHSRGEVVLDAAGQPVLITAIAQDVTDRRQIEEELRASREQLRQLSGHLQATREAERAAMSREIHDELGGTLTGLKMEVARLAKNADKLTPAELRRRAANMSSMIDGTVQTVRRIASDLRPGILDDFGLAAAIEWQLQDFGARSGLECEYESTVEELDLDPASSTGLFRLFQETLTNVARHAQATRVSARLDSGPDELTLEVRDNGRGITTGEIANVQSLGLLGMRERVHLLNGQLSITGAPGQGTTVLIKVPLARPATPPERRGD